MSVLFHLAVLYFLNIHFNYVRSIAPPYHISIKIKVEYKRYQYNNPIKLNALGKRYIQGGDFNDKYHLWDSRLETILEIDLLANETDTE